MTSNRTRLSAGVITLGSLLTAPVGAQDQAAAPATFVTFAVPGAGGRAGFGTFVSSIDPGSSVDVVGIWEKNPQVLWHGFLRTANGAFTAIKPPGAVQLAFVNPSINTVGTIAGFYYNPRFELRGFVRSRPGSFTIFDLPDHGSVVSAPPALNAKGAITGFYLPAGGKAELGYLRNPDGSLISFAVPKSQGTFPLSIDPVGNVRFRGFVRTPDGTLTTLDVPGALASFLENINSLGEIAGNYYDNNKTSHGFLRSPSGSFTTFDPPGAGTGQFQGTFGAMLDPAGNIAGNYIDAKGISHGYLRSRDGTIAAFDVPGATSTEPAGINSRCVIAGTYADAKGVGRGFLRFPAAGATPAAGAGAVCR
jgi:hypothetical protein